MGARERAILTALLVIAVLGPTFFVAGLLARGLDLLHADLARVGMTFLVLPNLQLDVSAGKGLSREAPDWFAGAGVSFRLPG